MNKKIIFAVLMLGTGAACASINEMVVQPMAIFDGSRKADSRGLILLRTRKIERTEPYFDKQYVQIVTEVKRYRIADREKYADHLAAEKGCTGSFWGAIVGLGIGILAALLASSVWPVLPLILAGAATGWLLGRKSGADVARSKPEEFETQETKIYGVQ